MPNMFDINVETETVSYDKFGNPIIKLVYSQKVETQPDGTQVHKTTSQTIQLMDGLQYNSLMSSPKLPNPIYVTTCAICRDPRLTKKTSHGLVSLPAAKRCGRCGKLLCPRHVKTLDNEFFCIRPCARIHKFKKFLKSIFFKEE